MNHADSDRPSMDALRSTAAEWLTRCSAGLSAAEASEFVRWRDADPRHAAAFEQVQATHQLLTRLPESPAAAAMMAELDELVRPAQRSFLVRYRWQAGLALAAAACLALVVWFAQPRVDPDHTVYATDAGRHQSIGLTDGTTLVLKADSELEVAFVPTERRVRLRRGEAHFFVAKDVTRPFLVNAGTVTVRAVGTAFNVRREAAAVEVLVTEGKVQVSRGPEAESGSAEPIFLVSGQSVLIDSLPSGLLAAAGDAADGRSVGEKLLRPAPRLYFNDTPLSEVVSLFNRYNQIQMELAEPELGLRAVGGNFDADKAESFIALLSSSGDVRVEWVSPTRVLLHRAR